MQKWVEDQFARFAFDMQNYVDALLAGEADVMKVPRTTCYAPSADNDVRVRGKKS